MNNLAEPLLVQIRTAADEIMAKGTVQTIDYQGYQTYLKTGNRLIGEAQYFERRRQLAVLGLDAVYSQRTESLQMLEAIIWQVCSEYSWALPAHLSIRDQTYVENEQCIDLFAAETAQTLSELKELLEEKLSPLIKKRIDEEIERRVLQPFEQKEWEWETKENNWSAVIAGSIGMTALGQLPCKGERQRKIIQRLEKSFSYYLKGFQADGVCVEGIGYWAYGFGYYLYFAEKLEQHYGDDSYLTKDIVKAIAEFPYYAAIGHDRFLPFSDHNDTELPTGLLTYCRKRLGAKIPEIIKVSNLNFDHCYRFAHLYRNIEWTEPYTNQGEASYTHYFSDAQWLVINHPKKHFVFSAKGGSNSDSHNHNDVGHFILGNEQTLALTDLGAGEYTRAYFDDNYRYEILNNRSLGHSVPLVNGFEQRYGPYSAQEVRFTAGDETSFSMNLTDVYPPQAELESFVRTFHVNESKELVTLIDEMAFMTETAEVIQNFISLIPPIIEEHQVVWNIGTESFILNIPATDEYEVQTSLYSDHHGKKQIAYQVQLKNKEKTNNYYRKYQFKNKKIEG